MQSVKEYVENLPCLVIPCPGEPLYLYSVTSSKAISVVLVQERGKRQKPIYFVSQALHDVETRYHPIEKATLALVHSARKLKPYFQSHVIRVLIDLPLKQFIQKPKTSGRLMKRAFELGEHEIEYLFVRKLKSMSC